MSGDFSRGARIRSAPKPPEQTQLPSLPMFLLSIVGIAQDDYHIKTLQDLQAMVQRAWLAKEVTEQKFGPSANLPQKCPSCGWSNGSHDIDCPEPMA